MNNSYNYQSVVDKIKIFYVCIYIMLISIGAYIFLMKGALTSHFFFNGVKFREEFIKL